MKISQITSLDDPRVAPFARLTEARLRNRLNPSEAIFIAESPKVINVALDAGLQPLSLLCEERHIAGDAAGIISRHPELQILTGERELLERITGYTLTRGVLCAMRRPEPPPLSEILKNARRVAVIDGVTDTTNIGSIFRSAAALGIDAVLLTPTACDPLTRRSVRVSMGSVFLVPWTWLEGGISRLKEFGFVTAAMALTDKSVALGDPSLTGIERLAILLGTEGDGLSREVISEADIVVRIPMSHGVDSLNVGAAAAVAFWEFRVG